MIQRYLKPFETSDYAFIGTLFFFRYKTVPTMTADTPIPPISSPHVNNSTPPVPVSETGSNAPG